MVSSLETEQVHTRGQWAYASPHTHTHTCAHTQGHRAYHTQRTDSRQDGAAQTNMTHFEVRGGPRWLGYPAPMGRSRPSACLLDSQLWPAAELKPYARALPALGAGVHEWGEGELEKIQFLKA